MNALYDLPAPAKVNLFLHVVGRRADGYHLLQSVFVLIDWADTLHLERRNDADVAAPRSGRDRCPTTTCACARRARCSKPAAPRWAPTSTSTSGCPPRRPGRRQLRRRDHPAGAQSAVGSALAAGSPERPGADAGRRRAVLRARPQRLRARRRRAAHADRAAPPVAGRGQARRVAGHRGDLRPARGSSARPPLLYSPTFLQTPS